MAHKLEWIEEPWIMHVTYIDKITVEDVETVMTTCLAAVEKQPVNFLVEMQNVNIFDPSMFRSKPLISLVRHGNAKWFALLGVNGMLHLAAQTLLVRAPFKSFTKREDAIAFLHQKADKQKAEAARIAAAAH